MVDDIDKQRLLAREAAEYTLWVKEYTRVREFGGADAGLSSANLAVRRFRKAFEKDLK